MSGRCIGRKAEAFGRAPTWERWVDKKLAGDGLVGKAVLMALRKLRGPFIFY